MPTYPLLFILDFDSGPSLKRRNVSIKRTFQPYLIQNDRMQCMGKRANFFQGALHHFAHFLQLFLQRRFFPRRLPIRTAKHNPNGCQNLTKLVMQFARDRPKGVLLEGNELLRQFSTTGRQVLNLFENMTIVLDQIQTGNTITASMAVIKI